MCFFFSPLNLFLPSTAEIIKHKSCTHHTNTHGPSRAVHNSLGVCVCAVGVFAKYIKTKRSVRLNNSPFSSNKRTTTISVYSYRCVHCVCVICTPLAYTLAPNLCCFCFTHRVVVRFVHENSPCKIHNQFK